MSSFRFVKREDVEIILGVETQDTQVSLKHRAMHGSFTLPPELDNSEFAAELGKVLLAGFAKAGYSIRPRMLAQYKLEHLATLYVVEALADVTE